MKIQDNPGNSAHAYGQIKRQQQAQAVQTKTDRPSGSFEAEASTGPTSPDQLKIGDAKGVIRHLQEGHYQGVAQLRLAIVHAEPFKQAAARESAEILEAAGERLTTELQDEITSLYAPLDNREGVGDSYEDSAASVDVGGAMSAFKEALESGIEDLETGQTIETFEELYSMAFQALLENLKPVSSQAEDEIATVLPVTGTTQPPQSTAEVVQEQAGSTIDLAPLQVWFDEALNSSVESMQNQIEAISAPPLPVQPAGNGAAYEKFLAVYQEIYRTTQQQETTPRETDAIETEA